MSNPYRAGDPGNATAGWTVTDFDTMERPVSVWNISGSGAPSCGNAGSNPSTGQTTTSYNVSYTLPGGGFGLRSESIDQAQRKRQMVGDALGRLLLVNEDPSGPLHYTTSYTYDGLDNLTGVTQSGQSRTFQYDSLKRLTSSLQPEMNPAGGAPALAASYNYTNDGLVATKTDGAGITTTYGYDPLNRPVSETHSGSGSARSATITRCYDGSVSTADLSCSSAGAVALFHGRLTESRATLAGAPSVTSISSYTSFDALGRILASQQVTNGGMPFAFQYEYDLAGELTAQTNVKTGRRVATAYNLVGQPAGVSGVLAGVSKNYVSGGLYTAHGGLLSATINGNASPAVSWVESWTYNSRLQPTGMTAAAGFSLGFDYGSAGNNGNLASQTITRPGKVWTQVYGYDAVNRLKTATETGQSNEWGQTYDYTATGNRYVSASPGFSLGTFTPGAVSNFDGGNHVTIAGLQYDAAGNETQMGAGLTMAYDSVGRMQTSTLSGLVTSYVYDADGHRVMKQTGAASTTFVYDAFGQLAMEVGGTSAAVACTTCFLSVDHLGSTRQVTDAAGAAVGCHDYVPFGEELDGIAGRSGACWGVGETAIRFTGKERDSETVSSANGAGLDYFGARYMSAAQGRFTSPDPIIVTKERLADPQRLNLYAYTRNTETIP